MARMHQFRHPMLYDGKMEINSAFYLQTIPSSNLVTELFCMRSANLSKQIIMSHVKLCTRKHFDVPGELVKRSIFTCECETLQAPMDVALQAQGSRCVALCRVQSAQQVCPFAQVGPAFLERDVIDGCDGSDRSIARLRRELVVVPNRRIVFKDWWVGKVLVLLIDSSHAIATATVVHISHRCYLYGVATAVPAAIHALSS